MKLGNQYIQLAFHQRTGVKPSVGLSWNSYGSWRKVILLRVWCSAVTLSFNLQKFKPKEPNPVGSMKESNVHSSC